MKRHKFKNSRKGKSKKATPLPRRNKLSSSAQDAFAIAAAFTAGLTALFEITQDPAAEGTITEDAEFTIEDPKQLPHAD